MPRGKKSGRAASGDGSIRKKIVKKNGKEYTYWEARYTSGFDPKTGKQKQHSISGKTQAEVAQKLREVTAEIGQGIFQEACKLTVGQWLTAWEQDYLVGIKPRTQEAYRSIIKNHLQPELGAARLDILNAHTIQHFYNGLRKKGLSPKTIKNIHEVFHEALQQAVMIGYLRVNPSEPCALPRVVKKDIKPLDDDAIRRFLEAVQGHRFELLYLVTLFTGLRKGEVLGLAWDRVDFDKGTLLIDRQLQRAKDETGERRYSLVSLKNDRWRRITPADFVMELLRRQRSRQAERRLRAGPAWEGGGLVFTNEAGGHLSHHTVYHNFKLVVASIGMPEIRFHDLRHSFAVASIRSGDDIKTVQGNLGHATAAFTLDIYGHISERMKDESSARMQAYIDSIYPA